MLGAIATPLSLRADADPRRIIRQFDFQPNGVVGDDDTYFAIATPFDLGGGEQRWQVVLVAPGLDVAGFGRYCDETGGDFYDILTAERLGEHQLVMADARGKQFTTMSLGVVDAARRSHRFASAGHDPTIIYRVEHKRFDEVGEAGLPRGVADDGMYAEHTVQDLSPGDVILLGTAGL